MCYLFFDTFLNCLQGVSLAYILSDLNFNFRFCFTSVFLQDDVSSPGDLVIADGGKYIKLHM